MLVGQSTQSFPASTREQFYVSCSRGRESVTVYCYDKEALREVVGQSEDRITATDLMTELRRRELVELAFDRSRETPQRVREERAYER